MAGYSSSVVEHLTEQLAQHYLMLSLIVLLVLVYWMMSKERLPGIPGPPSYPVLGNITKVSHTQLLRWAKHYGSVYKIWLFDEEVLVVTGTEAIMEACKYKAAEFDGRANRFRYKYISINFSDLIFTSGCPRVWKTRRFVEQHLTEHLGGPQQVEQITMEVVHGLVRKLGKMGGTAFDPVPIIMDTSLQIMHLIMFHEKLKFGNPEFELLREINKLSVAGLSPTVEGLVLDRIPWLRFIYSKPYQQCQRALALYHGLYNSWKERCKREDLVGGVVRHLIKVMVESKPNEQDDSLTDDNIVTLVQNLMVAGNMNISSLMASLLNILTHYPDVQQRLHQELDRVVGESREVTMHDEVHMTYTQAVVLELLRFAHPAPFGIQRKTMKNTKLCGYPIPKNTNLLINLWGHHHNAAIWPEPYVFRPERFLTPTGQLRDASHPSRVNLMPFGVGSRMCPGARLGLQHLFLIAATILKKFRVCPSDTDLNQPSCDPRQMPVGIVMMPNAYKIRLETRERRNNAYRSSTPSSSSSFTDMW